jgi:hypothetical protein
MKLKLAFVTAALVASFGAQADTTERMALNGLHVNGLRMANGISANGLMLRNALSMNGMRLNNGLHINGLRMTNGEHLGDASMPTGLAPSAGSALMPQVVGIVLDSTGAGK